MIINFHGVAFHSHKFIYAEAIGPSIHIHLEGLPDQHNFVSVSAKTNAQAATWLEELTSTMNGYYRSEIAMQKKFGA